MTLTLSPWSIFGAGLIIGMGLGAVLTLITFAIIGRAAEKKEKM